MTDERTRSAMLWAAEQGCVLDLEGEVGFGRPCVGVKWQTHYVDTPGSANNEHPPGVESGLLTPEMQAILERVRPPEGVRPYHKHDCLAVLGHGPSAVDELLRWIEKIRDHGGRIVVKEREEVPGSDHPINWLIHGRRHAVVEFPS